MLDLAENGNGNYIAMKKIAERQGISLKYPERILPVLTQNNMIRDYLDSVTLSDLLNGKA